LATDRVRFSSEPLYVTHAGDSDVDHHIELTTKTNPDADDWIVWPSDQFRGGESYHRYQRLSRYMSHVSADDAAVARIAQRIAVSARHQRGIKIKQLRCRKHMLQPMDVFADGTPAERDPSSPVFLQTVYAANVLYSESRVQILKVDAPEQVAQPGSPIPPESDDE